MSIEDAEIDELLNLRRKCKRFRILVVGRANAGKTTICQKMCNTTEQPVVYDANAKGNVVNVSPTSKRGVHDINAEITYPNNPGYVFHDSNGMESGSVTEKDTVMSFIRSRRETMDLQEQLHAIWFCIPMDDSRPLLESERSFFMESRSGVPVVLVFTKCDALETRYFDWDGETDIEAQMDLARQRSVEELERLKVIVNSSTRPPNGVVELYDMHKPEDEDHPCASAKALVDKTAECLDVSVLRVLFMSVQSKHLELCAKYAIRDFIDRKHRNLSSAKKIERYLLSYYPLLPYVR
ncbi:hypothetical protein DL96DRAFT_507862 [Flagelloscypha sp. PMI_526]|nr:hypothetical protein DL96DRAFT_507862 [Flagelloscypha sp. PMI_526]